MHLNCTSRTVTYTVGAQTTKHRDGLKAKAGLNAWQGGILGTDGCVYVSSWKHFIEYPTFCSELNIEN